MKSSYKLSIFDFKLIKDIYETQSFSEAAKLNNISQPAVSKRVKEISNNLCEVFLRKNKKIALTNKGKEIYHFANQTLLAYNDLLDKLTSDFEQTIVLGSDISYLKTFLSTIQKNLPEHHKLSVQTYSNSRSIFEALLNDQIDLGIMSGSYTQKGVLKIQLRADKLTIVGQKELIEAFDNGQETLFLLYHMTSSYHNFLKEFIKINQLPTQHHLSIDNLSLIEHEVLSGTGITIVSQDIADRMLTNDNIVTSSQKFRDVFIKTYAIIKMDNTYYQDLIPIIQKLKK
ncbi:LysR family transcriptional regulator [Streptococcus gallolyticus subsp. gallolyticus]|uniref:LysR family transcriptional regulator n=1 Tax=Streptococcus gallolyticus TaxID=315405 RepID=UPI0007E43882|nr:LysR family transcriptional regulator [Streptococcus gallolyticus]MCL4890502.1 LysR family transcriptional regulator [Streptococcus gallolyticus]MCY7179377.1 LysR family transcriptional regulator [Streptococcus gallolyticus subsp. gallolyticus]MCY7194472.1 LysR family transcriptional regulator [Streptococcus gallolyticus subsp. gallolyticus]OAV82458.1 LysR family transcriptional regulator [Streptococcus gallolyticus subsp. gallolyticus]OCW50259.1 LysR family transcriptional regulator [Strep